MSAWLASIVLIQAAGANMAEASPLGAPPPATAPGHSTGQTARRAMVVTVPMTDGAVYLGDVALTVHPEGEITMPSARVLDVLAAVLDARAIAALRDQLAGRADIGPADLAAAGIPARYDPQKIELALTIPSSTRATRSLQVLPLTREVMGVYEAPARFSAYLNVRGSIDYLENAVDSGVQGPTLFVDEAARYRGVVLESEGTLQPVLDGERFERHGTRFVFDDRQHLVRWTVGDLRVLTSGFQPAQDIAGISLFRSYSVLQPQMIARPTGRYGFRIDRPSTVEIEVNGRVVRRMRLDPGSYDLRDFPFTQGIDDVRVSIQDDSGRVETLRFNLFSDQTQLAAGLSEFGLYGGVKAPLGFSGPRYSNDAALSGFYRRGFTDRLTLGANLELDADSRMAGLESIFSGSLGAFGTSVAASHDGTSGTGFVSLITFQRVTQQEGSRWSALNLSAETRSRSFGPQNGVFGSSDFSSRFGAAYSHAFNPVVYAGIYLEQAHGRGAGPDAQSYRATLGWHPSSWVRIDAETSYQDTQFTFQRGWGAQLSLTVTLDAHSSTTADYDSRQQLNRLTYRTLRGEGVGSMNAMASVERTPESTDVDATANVLTSAAELGIEHIATFDTPAGASRGSRSALNFGTSAAFADGAFSIGRPIYDSFAIVTRHRNLKGAGVTLDPTPYGYTAETTLLGTATEPSITSYSERTITIDSPDAAQDVDLGQGAFRVLPPYRSGYRLQAGSEYSATIIGRLLDEDGEPLSFIAGSATESAAPERPPIELFTNHDGRFGLAGVRPGRWRIRMESTPTLEYVIEVPEGTEGVMRPGDLKPVQAGHKP